MISIINPVISACPKFQLFELRLFPTLYPNADDATCASISMNRDRTGNINSRSDKGEDPEPEEEEDLQNRLSAAAEVEQSDDKTRSSNGVESKHSARSSGARHGSANPLPPLSTSLGSPFTINSNPGSSVLPKALVFNNGSFVDTMTQQLSIHVEQPVGSMSISPSSRDVVLAA